MHLAEFNIARLNAPTRHSRVSEFMSNIDRINALAERMPGFVWRWRGDSSIEGDARLITTLSVWESAAHLEHFVFNTVHVRFFNRRSEWFLHLERHAVVMWWVAEGHQPSMNEAQDRLAHLEANGHTDQAFGWPHLRDASLYKTHKNAAVREA